MTSNPTSEESPLCLPKTLASKSCNDELLWLPDELLVSLEPDAASCLNLLGSMPLAFNVLSTAALMAVSRSDEVPPESSTPWMADVTAA